MRDKIKVILIDYADIYCQKGGCKDCRRGMNKTISKIKLLLHQRDNEIREWIQTRGVAVPQNDYGRGFINGRKDLIDDLLTYLSNRT